MKSFNWKSLLPHFLAVVVFIIIAAIVCKPALESGIALKQSDLTTWQGMSHQVLEYQKVHGHLSLWVPAMFSGMPAYQIALEGSFNPILQLDQVFRLWLPVPMSYFFLACISFYFLGMCLRIRPLAAILGALAFAYCSYNPIIITAGHNTKMTALAYAPAVLGACILIFNKKYLLGFTVATIFTSLQIAQGHQQVSYYLFLVLLCMAISYIVRLVKLKQTTHLLKSLALLLGAGIIAIAFNAVSLFPTYDYAKESKRGGQLVMDGGLSEKGEKVVDGKTTGLSKSYAFQWSYGVSETMSLMFPGVMGYGNHQAQRDGEVYSFPKLKEDAASVQFISEKFGAPPEQAVGFASGSLYWGKQPFTNGPVYLGAAVCFLFIMGMFYLDGKHKCWLFAASLLGILLALGSNFPSFNYFMFDHFPLYNKFRVPTMALIIPQLLFPIAGALFVNKLADEENFDWKKLRIGAYVVVGVFALALAFYTMSDFASENQARTTQFNAIVQSGGADMNSKLAALNQQILPERDNQTYEGMVGQMAQNPAGISTVLTDARKFVSDLQQDRKSLFLKDIGRSFLYVLLAGLFLFAFVKRKIKETVMIAGTAFVILIDLLTFDAHYLNSFNYDSKDQYQDQEFPLRPADAQILKDTDPNYRVLDKTAGSPFESSQASYYHKSIGGNHAAKLGIYDDLTANQLSGNINERVLDMLNTKYVIQQQGNAAVVIQNANALGNVWFVKGVEFVKGPQAEMRALDNFNPADTAVVDESFKSIVGNFSAADSTSIIKQTKFDNDKIIYESNAAGNHVAVFSEIFYKEWNAYIDGKKVPYFKANYVLRGLTIPSGKHTIAFKFEPSIFYWSNTMSTITAWTLMALLLICCFVYFKKSRFYRPIAKRTDK